MSYSIWEQKSLNLVELERKVGLKLVRGKIEFDGAVFTRLHT